MTTEQRELLREVLIDYLHHLTSTTVPYYDDVMLAKKAGQVRLLLREVA